jgi:hypothetical protein
VSLANVVRYPAMSTAGVSYCLSINGYFLSELQVYEPEATISAPALWNAKHISLARLKSSSSLRGAGPMGRRLDLATPGTRPKGVGLSAALVPKKNISFLDGHCYAVRKGRSSPERIVINCATNLFNYLRILSHTYTDLTYVFTTI